MATAFAHQVAGHPSSIQAGPDGTGATVIKPSSATELAFYTTVGPTLHPDFVGRWTPAFMGTLSLQGKLSEDGKAINKVEGSQHQHMLVLENLTFRFRKPNVLDIKLGTQLYDDDATPEKQERMKAASQSTTSGRTGIRLTGFKVWDALTATYVDTPKEYGKSITPAQLPEGISRFFHGIIESHRKVVVEGLLARLEALTDLWKTFEVRMRGGSLLIVVEGDGTVLDHSLERVFEIQEAQWSDDNNSDGEGSAASSMDSEGDAKQSSWLPFELRMIDFAHLTARPGEGPDEGVLLGLATVKTLLEGLL